MDNKNSIIPISKLSHSSGTAWIQLVYSAAELECSCGTAAVQQWYSCGRAVVELRYSCGTAVIQLRYSCGTAAVQLWYSCSNAAVQLRYSCGTAAVQLWYCWVLLWYCGTSYSEILGEILGENIQQRNRLTTKGASGERRAMREAIMSRSFLSRLPCWLELVTIKSWNTCRRMLAESGGREQDIKPHAWSIRTACQSTLCTPRSLVAVQPAKQRIVFAQEIFHVIM